MASSTTDSANKRKNDEIVRRRPQWLLLIIGIIIGGLLMFIALQWDRTPSLTVQNAAPDGLQMTATAIIEGATATARAFNPGS